jgi:ATP-dependent helicase IRC3
MYSYIKLLSYFNAGIKTSDHSTVTSVSTHTVDEPNVPIIGFTATFSRHDQLALSRVFQEIVYHQDVIDMLEAGWLSPARFTTVRVDLKLSTVAVSGSTDDYSATSLAKVMNTPAMNDLIVRIYLDRAGKNILERKYGPAHVDVPRRG